MPSPTTTNRLASRRGSTGTIKSKGDQNTLAHPGAFATEVEKERRKKTSHVLSFDSSPVPSEEEEETNPVPEKSLLTPNDLEAIRYQLSRLENLEQLNQFTQRERESGRAPTTSQFMREKQEGKRKVRSLSKAHLDQNKMVSRYFKLNNYINVLNLLSSDDDAKKYIELAKKYKLYVGSLYTYKAFTVGAMQTLGAYLERTPTRLVSNLKTEILKKRQTYASTDQDYAEEWDKFARALADQMTVVIYFVATGSPVVPEIGLTTRILNELERDKNAFCIRIKDRVTPVLLSREELHCIYDNERRQRNKRNVNVALSTGYLDLLHEFVEIMNKVTRQQEVRRQDRIGCLVALCALSGRRCAEVCQHRPFRQANNADDTTQWMFFTGQMKTTEPSGKHRMIERDARVALRIKAQKQYFIPILGVPAKQLESVQRLFFRYKHMGANIKPKGLSSLASRWLKKRGWTHTLHGFRRLYSQITQKTHSPRTQTVQQNIWVQMVLGHRGHGTSMTYLSDVTIDPQEESKILEEFSAPDKDREMILHYMNAMVGEDLPQITSQQNADFSKTKLNLNEDGEEEEKE